MIEIIKRKRVEGIILNIIIIIVALITIILNSNNYKQIFAEKNLISNKQTLNEILKKDKKFVTLDLTEAKLTRFSLKNNITNDIEVNIYELNYDNNILLIFLKENTAVTNKVKGELISVKDEFLEIKKQFENENTDKKVYNISFSNVDYMVKEKIIGFKFIISIFVILLMLLSLTINLFYYFNPHRTYKYKRYLKKNKN